jgi:hypothetical protein
MLAAQGGGSGGGTGGTGQTGVIDQNTGTGGGGSGGGATGGASKKKKLVQNDQATATRYLGYELIGDSYTYVPPVTFKAARYVGARNRLAGGLLMYVERGVLPGSPAGPCSHCSHKFKQLGAPCLGEEKTTERFGSDPFFRVKTSTLYDPEVRAVFLPCCPTCRSRSMVICVVIMLLCRALRERSKDERVPGPPCACVRVVWERRKTKTNIHHRKWS